LPAPVDPSKIVFMKLYNHVDLRKAVEKQLLAYGFDTNQIVLANDFQPGKVGHYVAELERTRRPSILLGEIDCIPNVAGEYGKPKDYKFYRHFDRIVLSPNTEISV
jgi:hypothetical protein